jgi:TolB protein
MRRVLSALRARSAGNRTLERQRRDCAVYAVELADHCPVAGTLRRLSPPGDFAQPMISPDGTRVAYWGRGRADDRPRVWVSDFEGEATARCLSEGPGIQGHPFWHPDGVRLLHFHSAAAAWQPAKQFSPDRPPSQLWRLDTLTGIRRQITDGPFVDERPAVTPDGEVVVFVSNRSGRLNLWHVDEDGGGLAQFTDGPGPDYRPCVSPDGRRLAYFSNGPDGAHQVRVRTWPAGEAVDCAWTSRFAWSHGPFWCADGEFLLVHALERGARLPGLWIVHLAGGEVRRIEVPGLSSASHGSLDWHDRRLAFDSRESVAAQPVR